MNATNCEHRDRKATGHGLCNTCYQREWRKLNRETVNSMRRKSTQKLRLELIEAYGGACVCCGETTPEFLTIDHINGDGKIDRAGKPGGTTFYTHLKQQGWPKERYRLLCYNCNCSYGAFGYCPHQSPDVALRRTVSAQQLVKPGPKSGEIFRSRFQFTSEQRRNIQQVYKIHKTRRVRERAGLLLKSIDTAYKLTSDEYKKAVFWAERYLTDGPHGLDIRPGGRKPRKKE